MEFETLEMEGREEKEKEGRKKEGDGGKNVTEHCPGFCISNASALAKQVSMLNKSRT